MTNKFLKITTLSAARFMLPFGVLAMAILPVACSKGQTETNKTGSKSVAEAKDDLRIKAEAFRRQAAVNPLSALRAFSTPQANLRFAALGQEFFTGSDADANWQLFFSTSLGRTLRENSNDAVSGFYHPWSDTMLIAHWGVEGGQKRIIGFDVIPGQVIRGVQPPYSAARVWQTMEGFAPENVARLSAQTMQAFEHTYGTAGSDFLAGLDPKLKGALTLLAALPFEDFRNELAPLFAGGNSRFPSASLWVDLNKEATSGSTERTGDIGDNVKILAALDPRLRASFTPVSYLKTDKGELLIVAAQLRPQTFAFIQTNAGGAEAQLKQFTLLDFFDFEEGLSKGEIR